MENLLELPDLGYEPDDLTAKISGLLVVTADNSGDALIDNAVPEILKLLREGMSMDVAFVSEFVAGQRVFRHVDAAPEKAPIAVGGADPLERSWCQRVVDGRLPEYIPVVSADPASAELEKALPFRIGTHFSTPIVLKSGEIYGTLCCFSFFPQEAPNPIDLQRLKYTAQLTAIRIDHSSGA
ncbi:MAG: hypothetical protein JWR68_2417 [Polaromonas sp.]|nr:hypothetical protein [Polaromonas sp.]